MQHSIALVRLCGRHIPGKNVSMHVVYADVMRPIQTGWNSKKGRQHKFWQLVCAGYDKNRTVRCVVKGQDKSLKKLCE